MTTNPARHALHMALRTGITSANAGQLLAAHAAEVRAAALEEAADELEARCRTYNGNCICTGAPELRRMAAAARPDDTTGA